MTKKHADPQTAETGALTRADSTAKLRDRAQAIPGAALTLCAASPARPGNTGETGAPGNADFIDAVMRSIPEGARAGVVSFTGNPNAARSAAWFARPAGAPTPANANNYFGISSYFNNDAGEFRRTKTTFAALHAIMLDDLGTKIAMDRVVLPLSWLIETSPGNYQGGLILDPPITDAAAADRLMNAVIAAGLCDPGASGPTARLARLPIAINGKLEPAFQCKLEVWAPDRRYSLATLVEGFSLELAPAGRPKKTRQRAEAPTAHDDDVYIPAPDENPVIAALRSRGLYKQPLGSGKHDISCPWCAEHTGGIDGGTAYFEPDDGFPVGGFKCLHSHGDHLQVRDLLKFLSVQPSAARMKPTIRVAAGSMHQIVDRAEQQLASSGRYYQAGGLIAAIQTDPATRETLIIPVTQSALTRAMARSADWQRYDARAEDWVVCDPPARHAAVLFDASEYPHLPILRGIARQPHLREDGSVVTQSGYDRLTGRFGVFDARHYRIPERPTQADALAALAHLSELLREVAFDKDADRSAALAAMLTAACRASLPTAPGFHVAAHAIGSGKSFLARLISALATPQNVPGVAFPKDADSMHKLLIAMLIKSPAVINFDDLNGDIVPSEALKTALTEEFIAGRILGVSKDITVSTRTMFLFSGNNVGPVRDMARRVLPINLDPRVENPVSRVFSRPNLEQEVRRDRALHVSSALTVIRAWIVAGCPRKEAKQIASYGRWADWCRQPLLWLDQPDPVERLFDQLKHDPDAELLGRMLVGWKDAHGCTGQRIRDVLRKLDHESDFYEAIRDAAWEHSAISPNRLGWWLKRHAGRIVGGLKFEKAENSSTSAIWKVTPTDPVSPVFPKDSGESVKSVIAAVRPKVTTCF